MQPLSRTVTASFTNESFAHLFRFGLLLLGLMVLLGSAATRADTDAVRSISVRGEAERRVPPDMATLQMDVVTDGVDAAAARAEADAITRKALQVLRQAGLADEDVDSTGLNVSPQYRWNKNTQQQVLTGYRVTRSITARLLDLGKLEELLTDLTDSGINRIQAPRMGLQDDEAVYREVLGEATRNARERAAAIAGALDESLGNVLQVSTQANPSPRPVMMERAMLAADSNAAAPSDSYQSGHITYRVQISATFALQ